MKFKIKIYYADTDCGGVVYYARYLEYFERARTEWFESKNLSVKKLPEDDILFIVKSAAIEYNAPAKYGDTIEVDIEAQKISGVSIDFSYTITNAKDSRLLVTGKTRVVSINKDMRPVRIPRDIMKKIKS
ncbi:MAG: thioesterase family protein [Elusimicrobiota bacterium]|nr:thioesterase family protein [Elusimicrobiota bacterium]